MTVLRHAVRFAGRDEPGRAGALASPPRLGLGCKRHASPPMSKLPVALAAVRLLPFTAPGQALIYVASGDHRAEGVAHLLSELATEAVVAYIPAWDCLPYDRASPSPDVLGARCRRCAGSMPTRPGSARWPGPSWSPRPRPWCSACRPPRTSPTSSTSPSARPLDPARLRATLERFGYRHDDRVDDHGEFALRGEVVDVFPPGPTPYRLVRRPRPHRRHPPLRPASQRSTGVVLRLTVDPVSTVVAPAGAEPIRRFPGLEHACRSTIRTSARSSTSCRRRR